MRSSRRNSGTVGPMPLAVGLLALAACAPAMADDPAETVLVYRMRGEVRPLLFWLGRDDVGGGRIVMRRSATSASRWREEIEVLFGSDPARIPRRINRWGYGRETAVLVREGDAPPRLLETEFQGFMRHSAETSLKEATAEKGDTGIAKRYDVTQSAVRPDRAEYTLRTFSDDEDFQYRRPERLLAKYRDALVSAPPVRQGGLANAAGVWAEPYGFLSLLARMTEEVTRARGKRVRSSATFVYNATPYTLKVVRTRRSATYQARHGGLSLRDVAVVEFQCFNTVKRTRTDFTIWAPTTGELKGLPVRILYQPQWWLRLDLDLDPAATVIASRGGSRTGLHPGATDQDPE
jgi:hypothetical protein